VRIEDYPGCVLTSKPLPQPTESLLAALQSLARRGQNDFIAFDKFDPTGLHSKQEDDS
jgi:hypothetical protein